MPPLWIIRVKQLRGRAGKSAHSKCEIGCIHSITRSVRKKSQSDPTIQFHPDYKKHTSQVYLVSSRSGCSGCHNQTVVLVSICQTFNRKSHHIVTSIHTSSSDDYPLSTAAFFIYVLAVSCSGYLWSLRSWWAQHSTSMYRSFFLKRQKIDYIFIG